MVFNYPQFHLALDEAIYVPLLSTKSEKLIGQKFLGLVQLTQLIDKSFNLKGNQIIGING